MKLSLNYSSSVNPNRPEIQAAINARVRQCLKQFPTCAEGSIWLDGIEHWFVYVVRDGVVDMHLVVREVAEQALNALGMSTHEPFNPLPGSERPH
jgi:hypothetical protein